MTREALEEVKRKPHGPVVDEMIAEIEACWRAIESCDPGCDVQDVAKEAKRG